MRETSDDNYVPGEDSTESGVKIKVPVAMWVNISALSSCNLSLYTLRILVTAIQNDVLGKNSLVWV
jgi:hypothetical protein